MSDPDSRLGLSTVVGKVRLEYLGSHFDLNRGGFANIQPHWSLRSVILLLCSTRQRTSAGGSWSNTGWRLPPTRPSAAGAHCTL
jgi:hypothetical protein